MQQILMIAFLVVLSGCTAKPVKKSNWWHVETKTGTCSESTGELDWITPENLKKEFGCEESSKDGSILVVSCEELNTNLVLSKDRVACEIFSKILWCTNIINNLSGATESEKEECGPLVEHIESQNHSSI